MQNGNLRLTEIWPKIHIVLTWDKFKYPGANELHPTVSLRAW